MNSARILALAAAMLLAACASEPTDEEADQKLAEFRVPCLGPGRPLYSPDHTECVIASYWERQRQLERLRYAAMTPPPPVILPPAYSAPAPQSVPAAAVVPPPPAPAATEPRPAAQSNPESLAYPGVDPYFSSAP